MSTLVFLLASCLTAVPSAERITVDGRLDEPAWRTARVISTFYETYPGENTEPPVKTEAFIWHDTKNLYAAFRCHDPAPGRIRASLADRDLLFNDDHVSISLDTFSDARRCFVFYVNAAGAQGDALFSEMAGLDSSWDAVWDAAARRTETGYEVEIAVPFKSLRFPRTVPQDWGMTLKRYYPRTQHYTFSSHRVDRNRNCSLCQMDALEGLTGMQRGSNLELVPSGIAQRNDHRETPGGAWKNGDVKGEGSLNLTWNLSSDTTLKAAVNPDFSHVESDVFQLDVNNRFSLYYPEKRPFFLESVEFFKTPFAAVYTRSIADPSWGAKLFARNGKTAYGMIVAQDDSTNFLLPGAETSSLISWDRRSMASVFRVRRDVATDSAIGILGTYREAGSYYNTAGGVDGRIRLGPQAFVEFQALVTKTQDPTAEENSEFQGATRTGKAFYVRHSHDTRNWNFALTFNHKGPGVRTDLGFERRVGVKWANATLSRAWYGNQGAFISQFRLTGSASQTLDFQNATTDRDGNVSLSLLLPRQTQIDAGAIASRERFSGTDFDKHFGWMSFYTSPHKAFSLYLYHGRGDSVDYANVRLGSASNSVANVTWKPGRLLSWDGTIEDQRLSVDADNVFSALLTSHRLYWHFTRRAFVRVLVQYQDVQRAAERYSFDVFGKDRALASQVLFAYKINPLTLVYLGHSSSGIANDETDYTTMSRSVFFKFSYAFRP